ncbi:hypothetical protein [Tolypothrix sp. VBCCA 56010]
MVKLLRLKFATKASNFLPLSLSPPPPLPLSADKEKIKSITA